MRRTLFSLALLLPLAAAGCATAPARPPGGAPLERGIASWYGPGFHGQQTASGERYDMEALTAAHRTLAFGTVVEVRNLGNGRSVQVTINDRGPFAKNRVIDLSRAAARALGMLGPGTALVELALVGRAPVGPSAYVVQVGAFQEPARAEQLAAGLCDDYPGVEVRSDGVWHRVQVGSFTRHEDAESLVEELAARGLAAVVVPLAPEDPRSR